jgi:hypothetical protein
MQYKNSEKKLAQEQTHFSELLQICDRYLA